MHGRNGEQFVCFDQAAAVPYRWQRSHLQFCLITTSSGRWGFPKGYIESGETAEQAALKEALEEAGLHGELDGDPVGYFCALKGGQNRTVVAFPMFVTQCDMDWIESEIRQRRWVSREEALRLLERESLRTCLEIAFQRLARSHAA
jgi:8-oxo-dGTP pyrophosphatase MutT (NUDIX family)